jgi:hypothetical protein
MGNIISSSSGLNDTQIGEGSIGDVTSNPFLQNMTDILLELDLYNKGNYNYNARNPPRSEFDYSDVAYNRPPPDGSISPDTANNSLGRPKNLNNPDQYSDIYGLPYVTKETTSSVPLLSPKLSSDGFYNIKRAVCNKSPKVPVSILGVDLPYDNPDMVNLYLNNGNQVYKDGLKTLQQTNLVIPRRYSGYSKYAWSGDWSSIGRPIDCGSKRKRLQAYCMASTGME